MNDAFDATLRAPRNIPMLEFLGPRNDNERINHPLKAGLKVADAFDRVDFESCGEGQALLNRLLADPSQPFRRTTAAGDTAVHELVRRWRANSESLFRTLCRLKDAGVSIDSPNAARRSPLHLASFLGAAESVKALLRAGHPIDPYDVSGDTPLFDAASSGSLECCELLIEAGARPRWRNSAGEAAWERAQARSKRDTFEFLYPFIEAAELETCASKPALAAQKNRL
jgi:ankyrin repeat protein